MALLATAACGRADDPDRQAVTVTSTTLPVSADPTPTTATDDVEAGVVTDVAPPAVDVASSAPPTTPTMATAAAVPVEVEATNATATPIAIGPGAALPPPVYRSSVTETFDPRWFERWGFPQPDNTHTMPDVTTDEFLRVHIPQGSHGGTSFLLPMPGATAAHLRYRVRFSATFDPSHARSDVKLPGFGKPVQDADGTCVSACGLHEADGVTSYSARSDLREDGRPGWYVYDVDAALTQSRGRGERWDAPPFRATRWYTVDQYIQMNTPGERNGRLRTEINGRPVFDRSTFVFRLVDDLDVGNAWFDIYYGGDGTSPVEMFVDFDDVLLEWG